MNLQRLLQLREGQRKYIQSILEQCTAGRESDDLQELKVLIELIDQNLPELTELDKNVLEKMDTDSLVTEMTERGNYNVQLHLKIAKEKNFYNAAIAERDCRADNVNQSSMPQLHVLDGPNPHVDSHQDQTPGKYVQSNLNLPKLSLPTFNGDLLMWQTFWDSFEASVHSNNSLSDVQKFSYLRSLLEDDAARSIAGLALTNSNYNHALDLLREQYGQKHKLTAAHMKTLLQLPTPSSNIRELRAFYDTLETNIRGLESLGEVQDSYGNLLIPVILERLPPETRRNLARDHGTGSWTLPELRKAIYREIDIMDAGEMPQTCETIPTASFFTGARKESQNDSFSRKCVFCEKLHNGDCKKVSDVIQRVSVVKIKHLCFNCLSNTHQVSKCGSRFRCQTCKGKHHTSICQRAQTATPRMTEVNSERSVRERSVVTRRDCNSSADTDGSAYILHSTSKTSRPDVLLKTAIAPVCADDNYAETNILMDEGAQRSFITQKLANELQLKIDGTDIINLSAFGDSAHRVQRLETATVNIVADNGDLIPIRALIVPVIAKPLDNRYRAAVTELAYLQGLKLAHHVSMKPTFEISLLVGADFYWKIIGDRIFRGNGPTAVSSRIGYFLSGPLPTQNESTAYSVFVMGAIATIPEITEWPNSNMQSAKCTPTRIRKRKHAEGLSSEESIPWNGKLTTSKKKKRKAKKKRREMVETDQLRDSPPDSVTKPLIIGRIPNWRTGTIPEATRLHQDGRRARLLPPGTRGAREGHASTRYLLHLPQQTTDTARVHSSSGACEQPRATDLYRGRGVDQRPFYKSITIDDWRSRFLCDGPWREDEGGGFPYPEWTDDSSVRRYQ